MPLLTMNDRRYLEWALGYRISYIIRRRGLPLHVCWECGGPVRTRKRPLCGEPTVECCTSADHDVNAGTGAKPFERWLATCHTYKSKRPSP